MREKLVYKVRSLLVQAGVVVVCARGRARALAASSVWHTLFRRVMPDRRARDLEARGRGLHRGHNRERRVRVLLLLLLRVDHLRRGRLAPHRRGGTRHAPRRRRQKQGQGRALQTASGLYGRRGTLGRRCLLRMCVQRSGDSEKEVFFCPYTTLQKPGLLRGVTTHPQWKLRVRVRCCFPVCCPYMYIVSSSTF